MIASLVAGALSACISPSSSSSLGELEAAVRGGSRALACEWPAVVGLDLGCSATLVHPEVVVYAAHCGEGIGNISFGEDWHIPERIVATRRCVAHPDAALGNGFDVAFCLLAEPVEDVALLPIAAGCELDAVLAGATATLVGFGPDVDGGLLGIKRSATVTIGAIMSDLVVEAKETGTCAGDSGGPLLVDVPSSTSDVSALEQRLIGVVSAAEDDACGPSTDHYSYLPPLLPWLEDATGRDLTPCFDVEGRWQPTPHCARPAVQRGDATTSSWRTGCSSSQGEMELLATCGEAFPNELLFERTPPELELHELPAVSTLVAADGSAAETSLEVTASDAESGVAEVRFEVRDEHGVSRAAQRDEVPPYRLERLRLPYGRWDVVVTARDHARNERQETRSFVVGSTSAEPSCALGAAPAGNRSEAPWGMGLLLAARARRRRDGVAAR